VLAVTLAAALWLAAGGADPPRAGPVIVWADQTFAWAGGHELALEPGTGIWITAGTGLSAAFTLEVRAHLSGDSDPGAAWGVWLEDQDGGRVIYAIGDADTHTGEGYVTMRRCPPGEFAPVAIEDCPAVRPEWRWMPYPRVNPPGDTNTITLHRESSGAIRLRLNGERLGAAPVAMTGQWGVWARGGRESSAVLVWDDAAIWGGS
jgi:hypothetical protein